MEILDLANELFGMSRRRENPVGSKNRSLCSASKEVTEIEISDEGEKIVWIKG